MSMDQQRLRRQSLPFIHLSKATSPYAMSEVSRFEGASEQTYAILSRVEHFWVHNSTASTNICSRHGCTASVDADNPIFETVFCFGSKLFKLLITANGNYVSAESRLLC